MIVVIKCDVIKIKWCNSDSLIYVHESAQGQTGSTLHVMHMQFLHLVACDFQCHYHKYYRANAIIF